MHRNRVPRPRFSPHTQQQRQLRPPNQYQHQGGGQQNQFEQRNFFAPPTYIDQSIQGNNNPVRANMRPSCQPTDYPPRNQNYRQFENYSTPRAHFDNFNEFNTAPKPATNYHFKQNPNHVQSKDFMRSNTSAFENGQHQLSSNDFAGGNTPVFSGQNDFPRDMIPSVENDQCTFPNQNQAFLTKDQTGTNIMINRPNANVNLTLSTTTPQMQIPGLDTYLPGNNDNNTNTNYFQQPQPASKNENNKNMGYPPLQEQDLNFSSVRKQQQIHPASGVQFDITQPPPYQMFTGEPPANRLPQPPTNVFQQQHGTNTLQTFSSESMMTGLPIQHQQSMTPNFPPKELIRNSNETAYLESNKSIQVQGVPDETGLSLAKSAIPGHEKDVQWVHSFLLRRGIRKDGQSDFIPGKTGPKVCCAQEKIQRMMYLMASLQKQIRLMSQCDKDQFDEEMKIAINLKEEMDTIRKYLATIEVKELEKKVQRRKEKRARLKRQRQEKYLAKQKEKERRKELHKEIDEKLNKIYKEAEEKRQQVELKKTADKILSEVRKKTQDVTRSTDLLKNLKKLRKLRKDRLVQQGVYLKEELHVDFEDRLQDCLEVLRKQKDVYSAEDKALSVMLETEQEENQEKEREKRKQILLNQEIKKQKKEHRLLFGNSEPYDIHDSMFVFQQYYDQANLSLDALIQTRCDWDRFCVPENTPGGSRIPDGFVMPGKPSNDVWATALKEDT